MSEPLRILALDLSAAGTGWATNCTGGIESGVQKFDLRRGESPGMRWVRFGLWIGEMLARLKPEIVVYEQAHHRGGAATEQAYGFITRVHENCASRGIEFKSVHSLTLKHHATGNGRASKEEMILSGMKILCPGVDSFLLGTRWITDDEADALCILDWALDGFPETERKPAKKRKAKVTT